MFTLDARALQLDSWATPKNNVAFRLQVRMYHFKCTILIVPLPSAPARVLGLDLQLNLVPRVFVPLDQRSENESSGGNILNNKGNNRILPIQFHCAVCIYGACLKWLLPELSFSNRWSRGTKTLGTRLS